MKFTNFLSSIVISAGLLGFGYYSVKNWKTTRELIDATGHSERMIKADVGTISFSIFNKSIELIDLYKKRKSDQEKILKFLKAHDITDEEISYNKANAYKENVKEEETEIISRNIGVNNAKEKKNKYQIYFNVTDKIIVKTKNVEKISQLNTDMMNLFEEGLFISCDFQYFFTNIEHLRLEMIKEASENALIIADGLVRPFDQKIVGIATLRSGGLSIVDEYSGYYSREEVMNKKVTLSVYVDFYKESKYK